MEIPKVDRKQIEKLAIVLKNSRIKIFEYLVDEDTLVVYDEKFHIEKTIAGYMDYIDDKSKIYPEDREKVKQLYKEALGHDYDEPKQWELREINDIMNNAVTGWRAFSNPRYFPEPYRRQKGWERIRNDNEPDNSMDGFQEIPTEEMEQLGLPEEWLKQK